MPIIRLAWTFAFLSRFLPHQDPVIQEYHHVPLLAPHFIQILLNAADSSP